MTSEQPRHPAGAPTGGQFTTTARPETSTTLTPSPDPGRFGPNGEHVQALLDKVAALTSNQRAILAAHAPTILRVEGREAEVFCPAGDATRYLGLPRYRRLTQSTSMSARVRPLAAEVRAAVAAADEVAGNLPPSSLEAVRDAAAAMVVRGRVHAIAYETLTRAVRQAVGRIHPEDGPLHR